MHTSCSFQLYKGVALYQLSERLSICQLDMNMDAKKPHALAEDNSVETPCFQTGLDISLMESLCQNFGEMEKKR